MSMSRGPPWPVVYIMPSSVAAAKRVSPSPAACSKSLRAASGKAPSMLAILHQHGEGVLGAGVCPWSAAMPNRLAASLRSGATPSRVVVDPGRAHQLRGGLSPNTAQRQGRRPRFASQRSIPIGRHRWRHCVRARASPVRRAGRARSVRPLRGSWPTPTPCPNSTQQADVSSGLAFLGHNSIERAHSGGRSLGMGPDARRHSQEIRPGTHQNRGILNRDAADRHAGHHESLRPPGQDFRFGPTYRCFCVGFVKGARTPHSPRPLRPPPSPDGARRGR